MASRDVLISRFDQSFFIHLTRDFAIVLLIVVAFELIGKFSLVLYDFHTAKKRQTENTALLLAADVKSIMVNRGGPVAARTVYPILKKRYEDTGELIAVEPSPATTEAIELIFGFKPEGVPAAWPEGTHHEARIEIKAEEFCLTCHGSSEAGDTLGTVTVRRYLSQDLDNLVQELQILGGFGVLKTVVHTVLLYFLLKFRLGPLLALREVLARLSKAGSHLSHRVEVRSHDEFGELATNLNLFLDPVEQIVEDLSAVIRRICQANEGIGAMQERLGEGLADVEDRVEKLRDESRSNIKAEVPFSAEWRDSVLTVFALVETLIGERPEAGELKPRLAALKGSLEAVSDAVLAANDRRDVLSAGLHDLALTLGELRVAVQEIARFEERMEGIAEQGERLVCRLIEGPEGSCDDGPPETDAEGDEGGSGNGAPSGQPA